MTKATNKTSRVGLIIKEVRVVFFSDQVSNIKKKVENLRWTSTFSFFDLMVVVVAGDLHTFLSHLSFSLLQKKKLVTCQHGNMGLG